MTDTLENYPSLSTDQIAAFVELNRCGSLRSAAEALSISEQGLRNRLLSLEQRLRIELYRKSRGVRRVAPLTEQGRQFLPHAVAFLQRARELGELFSAPRDQEVHVLASQYLTMYVLIDAIGRFHARFPRIRIRLGTRSEQEVEQQLRDDPTVALGVAAPYEPALDLDYAHLFSLDWKLITPRRHRLARAAAARLADLVEEPLILFERGSTGRAHVLDAFRERGLAPRVEMETTSTEIIVRMVEARLGVAIVPLMPSGVVTRGRRVSVRPLRETLRPIRSGILLRRGERLSPAAQTFVDFVRDQFQPRTGRALPVRI